MRIIGFINIVPMDKEYSDFRNYLLATGYSLQLEHVLTLDPHVCDSYPEDGDYSFPDSEYLVKFSGKSV